MSRGHFSFPDPIAATPWSRGLIGSSIHTLAEPTIPSLPHMGLKDFGTNIQMAGQALPHKTSDARGSPMIDAILPGYDCANAGNILVRVDGSAIAHLPSHSLTAFSEEAAA